MTEKRYKALERSIEVLLVTIVLSAVAALLLGVWTLADLVF
jgi:hypothetical protein